MIKKILLTLFALIGVVIVTLAASISLRWDRKFEAPYPELKASSDPQVIARRNMVSGAYTGPKLHGGLEMESSVNAKIRLVPPDITSGPGGRVATWTEDEFVARFRAGERIPGSPMPWQAFGRMSDDDLRAIYRYLRSVPIS